MSGIADGACGSNTERSLIFLLRIQVLISASQTVLFRVRSMGLRKIVGKRSGVKVDAGPATTPAASSVPTSADLGDVFFHRSQTSNKTARDLKSDVILAVLSYISDGSLYSNVFEEKEMKVIHLLHNQRPSVWYKFKIQLTAYIAFRHEQDPASPATRSEVEASLGCKFVFLGGDTIDQDRHFLFQAWRNAVYCDGDAESVKQVIMFIDGFIYWYCTINSDGKSDFPQVPEMEIQVPEGFQLEFDQEHESGEKDMDCVFKTTSPASMAAMVTDVPPPCFPARLIIATIEAISPSTVSIVWSGNTKPYKTQFENLGIGGKAIKKDPNDAYGEYFRKKDNISIAPGADLEEALALFGNDLVKNAPVIVRIRAGPAQDEKFSQFVAALRQRRNCFFK